MKTLKPALTLAGAFMATALGGTALASHDSWPPPNSTSPRYVVVPQQPAVVGYVTAPQAYTYSYEPAPRYYYYEPAPTTYYYYERAPVVSYYYNDDSPFPRLESRD